VWESIDTFRWGPRNNDGGESSRRKSGSTSSGSEVEVEVDVEESAEFDYDSFDEMSPSAVQVGSSSSAKSSSKKVKKATTRNSSNNTNNNNNSNNDNKSDSNNNNNNDSNSSNSSSGSGSGSGSGSNVSLLPTLSHDLDIVSAAGFPTHTNYTRDFKDLLDYIYIEPAHFKILRVAPFPSEEVLSKHTALPSCAFPSDHLAVIVDLEFID
jgi:mRNA deadenylase 3'-5' endonuclease subunit Ccr4